MKTYTYKLQGDGRDSWVCNDDGNIYMVYKDPTKVDFEDVVEERMAIGRRIIRVYLADNAALDLTFAKSVDQLQKFQTVKEFLKDGNLKIAKILINNAATDEVFTQERKDKYLAMFP